MNITPYDAWAPIVELQGHWITVQRLATRLRGDRPGIQIREQYSKFMPKRTVFMRMTGMVPAIVKVDHPVYPDKGGHGAKRIRRRKQ